MGRWKREVVGEGDSKGHGRICLWWQRGSCGGDRAGQVGREAGLKIGTSQPGRGAGGR